MLGGLEQRDSLVFRGGETRGLPRGGRWWQRRTGEGGQRREPGQLVEAAAGSVGELRKVTTVLGEVMAALVLAGVLLSVMKCSRGGSGRRLGRSGGRLGLACGWNPTLRR
jgi:hypothetical protein